MVVPDGLDSCRGTCPEGVLVLLAVEIGGHLVVPAIPDFLDKVPHLHIAFGWAIIYSPPLPASGSRDYG